ncbi:MAG: ribonuclease III [Verrucomicrobia bacterium]|nr:MAG: ribonuclease III [Verrucomicrobiota bacterium]
MQMELRKYILKRMFKPEVAKRAKAMRREKIARDASSAFSEKLRCGRLQKRLGYKFKNLDLLRESLVHPGYVGVSKGKVRSNQRLEFLGDAVLQCVITEAVYKKFDSMDEGDLTKVRIALTQGTFLAELSRALDLPKYLVVAHGSEALREMPSVAEDLFEAVVGAIYLDAGFEKTREVLLSWYRRRFDDLPSLVQSHNPKGALQELAVHLGDSIEYRVVSQSGPAHQKVFEIELLIGGKPYATVSASSKKAAESRAAKAAIKEYSKVVEDALRKRQAAASGNKPQKKSSAKRGRGAASRSGAVKRAGEAAV